MMARVLRPGFSLAEVVVALTIAGVLSSLLLGSLLVQLRLARATAQRAAATDALRTGAHVLAGELRRAAPQDLRAVAQESLSVRAFRGLAIVCGASADTTFVRHRGDRQPDPRKDSVVVVAGDAGETALALRDVRGAGSARCAGHPGEQVQAWVLSAPAPAASALLLFESGSFHLSGGALRYRLGNEGRQPITAEVLQPASGFHVAGAGTDRIRFTLAVGQRPFLEFAPLLAGQRP